MSGDGFRFRCQVARAFRIPPWIAMDVDHGGRGTVRRRLVGRRLDRVHVCRCACQRRLWRRCGPCLWCGR